MIRAVRVDQTGGALLLLQRPTPIETERGRVRAMMLAERDNGELRVPVGGESARVTWMPCVQVRGANVQEALAWHEATALLRSAVQARQSLHADLERRAPGLAATIMRAACEPMRAEERRLRAAAMAVLDGIFNTHWGESVEFDAPHFM